MAVMRRFITQMLKTTETLGVDSDDDAFLILNNADCTGNNKASGSGRDLQVKNGGVIKYQGGETSGLTTNIRLDTSGFRGAIILTGDSPAVVTGEIASTASGNDTLIPDVTNYDDYLYKVTVRRVDNAQFLIGYCNVYSGASYAYAEDGLVAATGYDLALVGNSLQLVAANGHQVEWTFERA